MSDLSSMACPDESTSDEPYKDQHAARWVYLDEYNSRVRAPALTILGVAALSARRTTADAMPSSDGPSSRVSPGGSQLTEPQEESAIPVEGALDKRAYPTSSRRIRRKQSRGLRTISSDDIRFPLFTISESNEPVSLSDTSGRFHFHGSLFIPSWHERRRPNTKFSEAKTIDIGSSYLSCQHLDFVCCRHVDDKRPALFYTPKSRTHRLARIYATSGSAY
jgi:hypothetical protein